MLLVLAAHALEPPSSPVTPPRWSLVHYGFLPGRVNPLGTAVTGRLAMRRSLEPPDPNILQKDTWVDLGLESTVSPSFATVGPTLRVKPLAVWVASVTAEVTQHFGILGSVLAYDVVDSDYSDPVNAARNRAGDAESPLGVRVTLSNTFQIAAGPVAIRNTTNAAYWWMDVEGVGFYEAGRDLLQPIGGWGLSNDLDGLYIFDDWIVGARYSYADALYGTGGTGDQPGHRVGPLIAWRGVNRTGEQASIQHLTAFTLFQWHVSHPFRAGQVSSAGIPLFAIALQWDGEVWRPASRRD